MNTKTSIRPGIRTPLGRRAAIWVAAIVLVYLLPQWFSSGLGIAVLNQMFIMVVFTVACLSTLATWWVKAAYRCP